MSRFIYGSELNHCLIRLVKEAELSLIILSPFIKLHPDLKDELKAKVENHNLDVIVVFGKNENDISKSLSINEVEFFKRFSNLEIRYEKRLHAKYYANEIESILTSMNLYEYSINNNIEFGVLSEQKLIGKNNLDSQSIEYFNRVIDAAEIIYKQKAIFKKSFGGLRKSYEGVQVVKDNLNRFYESADLRKLEPDLNNKKITFRKIPHGFCIRTGKKIELNPKAPFSPDAYKSWNRYKNEKYPEKYCHFTGELSNGETSFAKPIMRKNWKEASKYL